MDSNLARNLNLKMVMTLGKQAVGILVLGLAMAFAAQAGDPLAGLADPTRPSGVAASEGGARGGLNLQSTMVSRWRQVAVINGQALRVGDRIGGAELIEIRPYEVVLMRAGKPTTLRLTPKLNTGKHKHEAVSDAATP